MRKLFISLLASSLQFVADAQVNIPYREIDYNIHYHWGMVNVGIAHGKVIIESDGQNFKGMLDGSSIPWEGRIFCVSDTLYAKMKPSTGLSSETVTYANGWYMKPKVTQFKSGSFQSDDPANYKSILGAGTLDASSNTMEAIWMTTNMLGMFYYFNEMDFENMSPGDSITIPIHVEGGMPEKAVVTYHDKSSCKINDMHYPSYAVTFEYSYNGSMSGYPISCEVSVSNRLPLTLSAELPIGKVEMIYAGE